VAAPPRDRRHVRRRLPQGVLTLTEPWALKSTLRPQPRDAQGRLHGGSGHPKGGRALDEAGIREFLAHDYRRLVAGVGLACGSRTLGEEAVQEALARAWERTRRGEHIESLGGWVAVVALNLSRSWIRRALAEQRARGRLGERLRDEGPAESADDRLEVARALRALPRSQREVLVMHYFAGLGLADVARAVRKSESAVKALMHRGRASVARALGEQKEVDRGAGRR
jgi:RNA polymerase sigma-70 factor, ECF subfamily